MSTTRPTFDPERFQRIVAAADDASAALRSSYEKLKDARRTLADANGRYRRLEEHYGNRVDPKSQDVRRARSEIEAAEQVVAELAQEHARCEKRAQHALRLKEACREHAERLGHRVRDVGDLPIEIQPGRL